MNSPIEHSTPGISLPDSAPGCGEPCGYQPVTSAVSYAQSLNVAVPCVLRLSESSRCMVVYELPYALMILEKAGLSMGLAADLDLDHVVSKIVAAMASHKLGQETREVIVSIDNLSSDFVGSDGSVTVLFRDAVVGSIEGSINAMHPVRYTLSNRPFSMRGDAMPVQLSSYAAELRFAALGADRKTNEVPIHFDSEGYLYGPEQGALIAVTAQGIHCLSVSRPVLAQGTVRRLVARGYQASARPLHLSELVQISRFGWVDADFRLFDAMLFSREPGRCVIGSADELPRDIASIPMQDDILIPIPLEI